MAHPRPSSPLPPPLSPALPKRPPQLPPPSPSPQLPPLSQQEISPVVVSLSPSPKKHERGGGGGVGEKKSIRSPNIASMAASLDITFSPAGGRRGFGRVGSPREAKKEAERKGSLDLGVMGQWLKEREKVGLYFEGKGGVEGGQVDDDDGKKKKKGDKKGDKKGEKVKSVYGLSLQEMYEGSGYPIPIVVAQCMSYLKQSEGLKLEGIFRISAPIREVDRLKGLYKDPITILKLSEETDNPHVIACLLKQYFTTMPEPLLPFSETDALVEAYQKNEENIPGMVEKLTEIIRRIPYLECSLLRFLIQFLSQMGGYARGNFMTADNLGICFGPNLIRFKTASTAMMGSQIEAKITAVLIKNYSEVFNDLAEGDPPPLPEKEPEKKKEKKKKKARPSSTMLLTPSASNSTPSLALGDSPSITESRRRRGRVKSQNYDIENQEESDPKAVRPLRKLGASTSALPIHVRSVSPGLPSPSVTSAPANIPPKSSPLLPSRSPSSPSLPFPLPRSPAPPLPSSPVPLLPPSSPALPLRPSPSSPALPPRPSPSSPSLHPRPSSPLPPPRSPILPPRSPGGFQNELMGVLKGRNAEN